jgi:hypothetical protein
MGKGPVSGKVETAALLEVWALSVPTGTMLWPSAEIPAAWGTGGAMSEKRMRDSMDAPEFPYDDEGRCPICGAASDEDCITESHCADLDDLDDV